MVAVVEKASSKAPNGACCSVGPAVRAEGAKAGCWQARQRGGRGHVELVQVPGALGHVPGLAACGKLCGWKGCLAAWGIAGSEAGG